MPRKTKTNTKTRTNTKTKTTTKSLSKTLGSLSTIPGSPGGPGGPSGDPLSSNLKSRIESATLLFAIFLNIAALIINIYALNWINKLEAIPECKCSNNWMRTYVKYYLYITIPFIMIMLLLHIYLYLNNLTQRSLYNNPLFTLYSIFLWFVNIAGLINVIISIIFINKLKELNCECSEDVRRDIYYIYNIVLASFICISILMFFIAIPISILRLR
jgi:hypothetical protein